MGKVNYAILFEIKILHDYYLSQPNGQSFFELLPEDQDNRLKQLSLAIDYDIRKDLLIQPTLSCAQNIRNHRLKFVPTTTGFFLGAEVNLSTNHADQTMNTLAIAYDAVTNWDFTLDVVNPDFRNFTNIRFKRHLPSNFLFTNHNHNSIKNFPSLSVPVEPFIEGRTYEMGELVTIDGDLNQAIQETADQSTGWQVITNDQFWVNEADRILLPKVFYYDFQDQAVESALFTLKLTSGETVSTLNTNQPDVLKTVSNSGDLISVRLDFDTQLASAGILADGPYLLEVTPAGGSAEEMPVHLSDELFLNGNFAGITISSEGSGPGSAILDQGQELVRVNDTHPVFQIRFKNRFTYWRYRSKANKVLEPKNEALNFLEPAGNNLTTKLPSSLQRLPLLFENGGGMVFLPNPHSNRVKPENDGRVYSDIFISEVEGLIENKT